MKVPTPKDRVLTDRQIKQAICKYFMKNSSFPKSIIVNVELVSEILGIYLVPDNKLRNMSWTIYGMDIIKERSEKWFRLE